VTIRFTPRRKAPSTEFQLGSTSFGRTDGDFEATLVVTPGGEPRVRLTQLAWGAGVGWYAQHTLELGVEEAHQIAALLTRAPKGQQSALDGLLAASSAPEPERPPIDLAEVRARRVTGTTRTAPGRTGLPGQAPTPISSCDRAAPLSDEAATL
jgi:hypothetical protein